MLPAFQYLQNLIQTGTLLPPKALIKRGRHGCLTKPDRTTLPPSPFSPPCRTQGSGPSSEGDCRGATLTRRARCWQCAERGCPRPRGKTEPSLVRFGELARLTPTALAATARPWCSAARRRKTMEFEYGAWPARLAVTDTDRCGEFGELGGSASHCCMWWTGVREDPPL